MNHYEKAINNLGWIEITLWSRFTKLGLEYNHLEYGHCKDDKPTPNSDEQKKSWAGNWSKRLWYVERTTIPYDKVI